jgi:hypothetical protein
MVTLDDFLSSDEFFASRRCFPSEVVVSSSEGKQKSPAKNSHSGDERMTYFCITLPIHLFLEDQPWDHFQHFFFFCIRPIHLQ